MSKAPKISTYRQVQPMIYAYETPGVTYHDGWIKIGYTEKDVDKRVYQQTHTADVRPEIKWRDFAQFKNPPYDYFKDHDFHNFLTVSKNINREKGTEWFEISSEESHKLFGEFAGGTSSKVEGKSDYILRNEQERAVTQTKSYFENGGEEFLWNAKPRFGKTLSTYDLVREMNLMTVLVITNRPAVANSWLDDFMTFIKWRGDYEFVSETRSLDKRPEAIDRRVFMERRNASETDLAMIAFESLQGLKSSMYFSPNGSGVPKLEWMKGLVWDLLIIDEAHEGINTYKTDKVLEQIKRKHTLHLSGTPFKMLAEGRFNDDQIFNWTYADEQEAKENWNSDDYNPYEALPRLNMFTYQMSNMIQEEIKKGADIGNDETVDYAFDLNEFFKVDIDGKFIHEKEVKKFLKSLTTNEKYPFSTPELREELKHTLWILERVDSAKALAKLLKNHKEFPEFADYEIIPAVGDGNINEEDSPNDEDVIKTFQDVKNKIKNNDKTITLSVGKYTVGVTVPEWSGVLMLSNMKSPSAYMQAAFRSQNPHIYTGKDGKRYRKQNAYVFDFDPARTLIIFDEFANDLYTDTAKGYGTAEDRKNNIKRLLNFFPVIGEDEEGKMVELNAAQVLSIPRKLKSEEVVRRGFISNFLFQNISNIFGATGVVGEIIEKLVPAQEEHIKVNKNEFNGINNVHVDEDGEVVIPNEKIIGQTQNLFGEKIYEELEQEIKETVKPVELPEQAIVEEVTNDTKEIIKETIGKKLLEPSFNSKDNKSLLKSEKNRIEREINQTIDTEINSLKDDFTQTSEIAKFEYENRLDRAHSEEEIKIAEEEYTDKLQNALNKLNKGIEEKTKEILENKPKEVVERIEKIKTEKEKRSYEDKIRAHLRGFSRTIPSFVMAYGDKDLTLANFDDYTDDDVFEEVTGITEEQFRFLRDGGEVVDEETGQIQWFAGHLFDETVFNDSIQEFLRKKDELSDYFNDSNEEDIFDYIPAQRTNQIFTPKWVVKKMVDELEKENPGAFDNPEHTFSDLYMKSGLYITEIVKRLFQSPKMKELIPDDKERIRHIFKHQVYGMAPSKIIWLIATNFILGFDEELRKEVINHFVLEDAAEAAKNGTLQKVVDKHFG